MHIYFSLYIVARSTDPRVIFYRVEVAQQSAYCLSSIKQKVLTWPDLTCFVGWLFAFPSPFIFPLAHGHITQPLPKQFSNHRDRDKHRDSTQHKSSCGAKWGPFIIVNWFKELNAYADLSVAQPTGVLGWFNPDLPLNNRRRNLLWVPMFGPDYLVMRGLQIQS